MNNQSPPPSGNISIQEIIQMRIGLGSIETTTALDHIIAILDDIILNFAKSLNFPKGTNQ